MQRLLESARLVYPEDKTKRVQIKSYLHMREYWSPPSVFYRDRRAGSRSLNGLMGGIKVFDDPKSTDVLARLFHSLTDDGDLILDFFAGSGSSGQAVWEQNPKDAKTRNWILVQLPEEPDESEVSGKNAIKAGYNTIFDLTAERLRRAAKQLSADQVDRQLGFRVFRTRPTNLVLEKPVVSTPETTSQEYFDKILSAASGAPVIKNAEPQAVAWEVALKASGTRLDSEVIKRDVDGVTTYEFRPLNAEEDAGRLLVSLDPFTLETADALELSDDDTLILRGDKVEDSATLTLAPRLQSKLILLERVPREVSL